MDDNSIKTKLIEWVEAWRSNQDDVKDNQELSGEILDRFVSELQDEIAKVIDDFAANTIG